LGPGFEVDKLAWLHKLLGSGFEVDKLNFLVELLLRRVAPIKDFENYFLREHHSLAVMNLGIA
jgi:hypothetical protein